MTEINNRIKRDVMDRFWRNTMVLEAIVNRYEAQEVKEIMAVKRNECPCGEPLEYFSGLEEMPAFLFCPKCNDKGWNEDGEVIVRLE